MTGLLLLLALGRGAGLVLHEPLVGLANNYDMIRVQACIDAYPLRSAEVPPGSNSWQAPLERYTFIEDVGAPCFLSSEAIFAFAALPLLKSSAARSDDGGFPLRALGIIKLLCLWGACLWISALLLRA